MSKYIIALLYDFDKTLCTKDMQDYSFIPSLGMNAENFWNEANKISEKNDMDRILAYMYLMIKESKKRDLPINMESFKSLGHDVVFYNGVIDWFDRINRYGESLGVTIEHYIISSGLKEIILGTKIAHEFKRIYACEFHYNERGNADWPQQAVNFTTKTQFLFRISKGVLDVLDDVTLNSKMPDEERRIPYHNMIYIGDGLTDVPCMKLVKSYGGNSIAIFQPDNKAAVLKLLKDERVNFACESNYSEGSEIDKIVKLVIHQTVLKNQLIEIFLKQRQAIESEN